MAFTMNKGNECARIFKQNVRTSDIIKVVSEDNNCKVPKNSMKKIKLREEFRFVPMIGSKYERECLFIYGPSGSGKSTLTSQFVHEYKKSFKNNRIFLISAKDKDPVFDSIRKIKRIDMTNEDYKENPIKLEELSNSLVIFDDYEVYDKKTQPIVNELRDKILQLGRSTKISCIIISHIPLQGSRSKVILIESSKLIFFRDTNRQQNKRVLEVYCGLSKKEIDQVYDIKSRWYCLHRFSPRYLITEKEAVIL